MPGLNDALDRTARPTEGLSSVHFERAASSPVAFIDDTLELKYNGDFPQRLRIKRVFEGRHLRNVMRRAYRWLRANPDARVKDAPSHIRMGLMCLKQTRILEMQ